MNSILHIGAIVALLYMAVYAFNTLDIAVLGFALAVMAVAFTLSFLDAIEADRDWWRRR